MDAGSIDFFFSNLFPFPAHSVKGKLFYSPEKSVYWAYYIVPFRSSCQGDFYCALQKWNVQYPDISFLLISTGAVRRENTQHYFCSLKPV